VTPGVLLSLAAAGLLVGFLSGLLGIGGGVLIVPLLYFFYGHAGWSGVALAPDLHPVVSHATSLFVILPTSVLGAYTYHRAGAVAWSAALPIAGASIAGALVGARLALEIPAPLLKLGFGVVLLVSGLQLLRGRDPSSTPGGPAPLALSVAAGVLVGLMSALLGVGGGIVAIPLLIHLVRLPMEKVAATSMAIIVFTALAGVVGYVIAGADAGALPPGSIGYVHLAAGIPILVGALGAVAVGARVNRRLEVGTLRLLFAALFIVMGLRLAVQNGAALPMPW
jgi:uncharacterized membrane protein YfcA